MVIIILLLDLYHLMELYDIMIELQLVDSVLKKEICV